MFGVGGWGRRWDDLPTVPVAISTQLYWTVGTEVLRSLASRYCTPSQLKLAFSQIGTRTGPDMMSAKSMEMLQGATCMSRDFVASRSHCGQHAGSSTLL